MSSYIKTKIKGVYTKPGKKDTAYYIRYRIGTIVKNEKVGSKSAGMSELEAYKILQQRQNASIETKIKNSTQKKNAGGISFHFLKNKYFEKLYAKAITEQDLEKIDKTEKTVENIRKEESLYKNLWQNWKLKTMPLSKIKEDHVKAHLLEIKKEYSQKSVYNALMLAKSILKHTKEFYSDNNPFLLTDIDNNIKKKFERPQQSGRNDFLTEEECLKLLSYLKEHSTFQNYCMVLVSIFTGARPGSILHLKIKDINFKQKELMFFDFKRKMYYKSRLTQELEIALKQQIEDRNRSHYVFYSSLSAEIKAMSEYPSSIKRILDKLFNDFKEEFEERIVPYSFRHTFANLLLQVHKVPIFDVSKMLNHASIDTTIRNYVKYNTSSVEESLNTFENSIFSKQNTN